MSVALLIAVLSSRLSAENQTNEAPSFVVSIEVPELPVAEYHRPYIAVWIEAGDRKIVSHLAAWYDVAMPKKEGETWLKDLRQWWRRGGRSLDLPIDAVSGPTRPVGTHALSIPLNSSMVSELEPGSYNLMVEASREVGGREMLTLPFQWESTAASTSGAVLSEAQGESELGKVTLNIQ